MKTICFVFFVAFALEKYSASAQQFTVSACKDRTLQLNCLTGHIIRIENVILADSNCRGSNCCPRQSDCNKAPSDTYRNLVRTTCNGQPSCAINVEIRKIGCGYFGILTNNDYVNITYSCIALPTSPASTILPTPYPTTPSSSSASTRQHSTSKSFSTTPGNSKATAMGQQSTPTTQTPIHNKAIGMDTRSTPFTETIIKTTSYRSDDEGATEIEKAERHTTPSQWSVERFAKLNATHPPKPGTDTPGSEEGKSAALVQTVDQDKDYGYLDRLTTLVAVIVGGVVITATVISVAVVLALKKRRIAKSEEHYDMPAYSCNANNDEGNIRNSNIYDFIPDSGNCSAAGDSASVGCSAKENDYLTPVMGCEEEPYLSIQ